MEASATLLSPRSAEDCLFRVDRDQGNTTKKERFQQEHRGTGKRDRQKAKKWALLGARDRSRLGKERGKSRYRNQHQEEGRRGLGLSLLRLALTLQTYVHQESREERQFRQLDSTSYGCQVKGEAFRNQD